MTSYQTGVGFGNKSGRIYHSSTSTGSQLTPCTNASITYTTTKTNHTIGRLTNSISSGNVPTVTVNTNEQNKNTVVNTPTGVGAGAGEMMHNQYSTHTSTGRVIGHCAECGLRIAHLSDACHAMGYLYHNTCFVCCCCKRTLRGKVFYKDQDKVYCEEDYLYCGFQQTVEKCYSCGHIIAETILIALGNTYHPGCFRCCVCTKCLDGVPFTKDERNYIYCLTDYYLVHGSLCSVCGLAIIPENGSDEVKYVMALEKNFHVECYRCVDCKRLLGDEPENRCYPFSETDRDKRIITRLLCLNCHLQRIGAIPATSASTMPYLANSKSSTTITNSNANTGYMMTNHNNNMSSMSSSSCSSVISDFATTTANTTNNNTTTISSGYNKFNLHPNSTVVATTASVTSVSNLSPSSSTSNRYTNERHQKSSILNSSGLGIDKMYTNLNKTIYSNESSQKTDRLL